MALLLRLNGYTTKILIILVNLIITMPSRSNLNRKPGINADVSEYIWDLKTQRYKRNPDYRTDSLAVRYIFWTIAVLILVIAVIWCLRA